MKKLLLLSFVLLISLSCENQNSELILLNEPVVLSEEQSFEIVQSLEFQNYLNKRYEFLELVEEALSSGNSAENLTQVSMYSIREKDHAAFYETIFNSTSYAVKYIESVHNAKTNLYEKFPVLSQINAELETDLSEQKISNFYVNLELRGFRGNQYETNARTNSGTTCGSYWKQVKAVTCAGLCGASTGGAGSVLCLWACWCTFCTENSELADAIC